MEPPKPLILNESNFDSEVAFDEPMLVDFWAPWCTPCNMLMPVLNKLSADYRVGKVNVDENKELAVKYGISAIPALLFFKNGVVADSMVGIHTEATITSKLEALKNVGK